jgi:diguanylate cyclase (GGDEF)-like protein
LLLSPARCHASVAWTLEGATIGFDVRTALLLGALTTLLLGVLLAVVSREIAPLLRPALVLWLRGNLLQPIGFVLLALRGQVDDWLSVVVANVLIAIAFADYAHGLHRLMHAPQPIIATRVAIVIVAVAIGFFTLVVDLIAVRIVVASLVLAWLCWLSARVLLRGRWRNLPIAQRVTGGVFAVGTVILLWRALHTAWFPLVVQDGLQSTMVQAVTFATGALLPLVASYGFLLLCTDRMRIELERSAAIDFLTGALNRGATEDLGVRTVNRARRRGTPCAAIVIDVDHFKCINDAHGHAVGDAALREIAARLRETLRVDDTLGRIGGEEFLVLLDESDAERSMLTAERLRRALTDHPLALDGGAHPCTISLGVAVLSASDANFSDLLRRADRALYAAKAAGRNQARAAPG